MTNQKTLIDNLNKINGKHILVLGDVITDIYLDGRISRISREAPVLVLEHVGERVVAGGAANVVNNVATLGGAAIAAGVTGDDKSGNGLRNILRKNNVDISCLLVDTSRPTTSKTRIIAGGRETVSQQIVRVDHESHEPLNQNLMKELLDCIMERIPSLDGLVMSDYGGAAVPDEIAFPVIAECRKRDIPTIVDSRYSVRRFKNIDYVKQNDSELREAYKTTFQNEDDLRDTGMRLLNELNAKGVLITRGANGMTLFEASGAITDIPVVDKSEVYDVSGAGDTCVAMMILALSASVSPVVAAKLSNLASGIAVRKQGTATVGAAELADTIKRLMR
ncbi:MAG: bifunctional heptose 7-phosphate kinase/heptose 1-phosphate adenyltransferase [Selenomonadaceae bacterium]